MRMRNMSSLSYLQLQLQFPCSESQRRKLKLKLNHVGTPFLHKPILYSQRNLLTPRSIRKPASSSTPQRTTLRLMFGLQSRYARLAVVVAEEHHRRRNHNETRRGTSLQSGLSK